MFAERRNFGDGQDARRPLSVINKPASRASAQQLFGLA
jgi:hypothetical protein